MPDIWQFLFAQDNLIQQLGYDANNQPIYQGWAQPGSATSSAVWRIKKFNYTGSNLTSTGFPQDANGNASCAFSFVWDNRASLTFS